MADDDIYTDDDVTGGQELEVGEKSSFIKTMLPRLLKWVAIGLAAIIFIVTVVFVTMKILNRGTTGLTQPAASEVMVAKTPTYTWFSIEEVRSRTADNPPATVIVKVKLGYEEGSKEIQGELVKRQDQIFDLIRSYFSKRRKDDLTPHTEGAVKQELREQINRLLTNANAVQDIIFMEYNVYEF